MNQSNLYPNLRKLSKPNFEDLGSFCLTSTVNAKNTLHLHYN